MATQNTGLYQPGASLLTYTASGAIAAGDIVALTATGGVVATASTEATSCGVAVSDAVDGGAVSVCVQGQALVKCGEAFAGITTRPVAFVNDVSGHAHAATTGQNAVGYIYPTKQGTGYADLDLAVCIVNPHTAS